MSVEDDDTLATFFDVDEHAVSAVFTPAQGAAVAVTVIVNLPREVQGLGFAGVAQENRSLLVRKSEVTTPDGGRFSEIAVLGSAATFRVAESVLDDTGKVWTCYLKP